MLVSTCSSSHRAHGLLASQVIAVPGPGCDASVPVPTLNTKSTFVVSPLSESTDTVAKSVPDWKGWAMQLPDCVGLICAVVVTLSPLLHSRATTALSFPAVASTWTLTGVPSVSPLSTVPVAGVEPPPLGTTPLFGGDPPGPVAQGALEFSVPDGG